MTCILAVVTVKFPTAVKLQRLTAIPLEPGMKLPVDEVIPDEFNSEIAFPWTPVAFETDPNAVSVFPLTMSSPTEISNGQYP